MVRLLVLIAGLGLVPTPILPTPTPLTISGPGGATVSAQSYATYSAAAPVLLLFHQANASSAEYATLGTRFTSLGFNAIAVDQRASMEDALADMEATLAYARRAHPVSKLVAIGSSYSAGLVFELAAKHPRELAAIVAFSPAEYFTNVRYVRAAARQVRLPVFIDSASTSHEIASARAIYAAVGSHTKQQYVPRAGVHGASTLRDDRNPAGAQENFHALQAFLEHFGR